MEGTLVFYFRQCWCICQQWFRILDLKRKQYIFFLYWQHFSLILDEHAPVRFIRDIYNMLYMSLVSSLQQPSLTLRAVRVHVLFFCFSEQFQMAVLVCRTLYFRFYSLEFLCSAKSIFCCLG
jgi:hypothetical protein